MCGCIKPVMGYFRVTQHCLDLRNMLCGHIFSWYSWFCPYERKWIAFSILWWNFRLRNDWIMIMVLWSSCKCPSKIYAVAWNMRFMVSIFYILNRIIFQTVVSLMEWIFIGNTNLGTVIGNLHNKFVIYVKVLDMIDQFQVK